MTERKLRDHTSEERDLLYRAAWRLGNLETKLGKMRRRYLHVLKRTKQLLDGDNVEGALNTVERGIKGHTPGTNGWMLLERTLHNDRVSGYCKICQINLYGRENPRPEVSCAIKRCPFPDMKEEGELLSDADIRKLLAGISH